MATTGTRLDKTCKALHKINKHAKKYANSAEENYRQNKKATAHKNSLRKKALYSLKSDVLRRLWDRGDIETVDLHKIDGREYYCFRLNGWSFHTPINDWPGSNLKNHVDTGSPKELEDFSADPDPHVDMSLKDALCYFNEKEFEVSANDYLEEERVSYGHQSYFIGWKYL